MSTDAAASERQPGEGPSSVLAAVANEMVRLYKEQFGRGPTKARANWCGDDTLCVTLEDTLTPAERNLAALGEHERLRETRMFFQYASVREFCEPVERIVGRRVRAFCSGMDAEVGGLSIESFIFYPAGREDDGPSRTQLVPPPVR